MMNLQKRMMNLQKNDESTKKTMNLQKNDESTKKNLINIA
jgi:hypothetical protein